MKGNVILLTGGARFRRSQLVDRLGDRNEVTTSDDLSTATLRNLSVAPRTVRLKKASVLQSELLPEVMAGQDVVYHLAAKTSVPESVAHPDEYWRTNVEGTVRVLKAAADASVPRVVFISSAAVYGDSPETPKVESMRPAPTAPYRATKVVGQFASEEIRGMTKLESVGI